MECARCGEQYPRDELYELTLDDTQGFHNWVGKLVCAKCRSLIREEADQQDWMDVDSVEDWFGEPQWDSDWRCAC